VTGSNDVQRDNPPDGRLAARARRAGETAADVAQLRVTEYRNRFDLVDAGWEAVELDRMRAGGLLAGGIAFRMFIWLLPAALLVTGILGIVHSYSPDSPGKAARQTGLGGVIAHAVGGASSQSHTATVVLIGTGLVFTIYTGMSLVRALRVASILAWGMPLGRRPHLFADGIMVSVVIIALLSTGGIESWLRSKTLLGGVLMGVLVALLAAGAWLWISTRLPHPEVPLAALVPGALLIWGGMLALHIASIVYFVPRLDRAPRLYGSLGIAATLLLWLYVIARLVVAGAFLNATLWYRHNPRDDDDPARRPGRHGRVDLGRA
jgi:uncharacterized BrkB/YihY/UPF0761 family membrane protein